jgi:hypothetical protein
MKKSHLITLIAVLVMGAVLLTIGLIGPSVVWKLDNQGVSVGIIAGGIDSPTYQDMMFNHWHGIWSILVHLGGAMILTACFTWIFHKTVQKCCMRITSLLAFGLSIFSSAFVVFVLFTSFTSSWNHMYYPRANLIATICVIVFALICLILFVSYVYNRFKQFSLRGLLLDMLLTIVYLPSFWWFWGVLMEFARYALQDVI